MTSLEATAREVAEGLADAVRANARILAEQAQAANAAAEIAAAAASARRDDAAGDAVLKAIDAAAPFIAAAALEPVYRWLVDDLAFPFDMHTNHKPAWLDVERLAAMWDAKDGEQPGTYLDAIYDETGWPRP